MPFQALPGTTALPLSTRSQLVTISQKSDTKGHKFKYFRAVDFRVSHRKIGDNWDRLAALTRSGEPTYQAKIEFQRSLERYYRTNGTEVSKASIDAVASEYSKALTEHFRSERRVRLVYGCAAAVGGAGVGLIAAPLGVLLAAGVGLAFAVATVTADVAGAPNALIKIAQGNGKKWITSEPLGGVHSRDAVNWR